MKKIIVFLIPFCVLAEEPKFTDAELIIYWKTTAIMQATARQADSAVKEAEKSYKSLMDLHESMSKKCGDQFIFALKQDGTPFCKVKEEIKKEK